MAIQTIEELEVGSMDSPNLSYYVYDDGDPPATITVDNAISAALAVAPYTKFGGAKQIGVTYTQEANHAWRIIVNYAVKKYKKLTPLGEGEERIRFNFAAQPKFLFVAPEIARYPSGTAPNYGGMLNIRRGGGGTAVVGATIPVPTENLGKQAIVSVSTVATLANRIKTLVGHVNSQPVGNYATGELMLTSFHGQQRDDDTFDINVGWSYMPNVSNETWGEVTGVSYKGHEYVWAYTKDECDRNGNALYQVPQFVYVNRVWPLGNLNLVGIYPP